MSLSTVRHPKPWGSRVGRRGGPTGEKLSRAITGEATTRWPPPSAADGTLAGIRDKKATSDDTHTSSGRTQVLKARMILCPCGPHINFCADFAMGGGESPYEQKPGLRDADSMRTSMHRRVTNTVVGAIIGFAVGAIVAVNVVIAAGVDRGYQASIPEVFETQPAGRRGNGGNPGGRPRRRNNRRPTDPAAGGSVALWVMPDRCTPEDPSPMGATAKQR